MSPGGGDAPQSRGSIAGSAIGGIAETHELLDFCAEHGFGAEIEVIAATEINEAYKRALKLNVSHEDAVGQRRALGEIVRTVS